MLHSNKENVHVPDECECERIMHEYKENEIEKQIDWRSNIKLVHIDGKGKGYIAIRDMEAGTIIIRARDWSHRSTSSMINDRHVALSLLSDKKLFFDTLFPKELDDDTIIVCSPDATFSNRQYTLALKKGKM